jgi:hypothetical protein
MNIAIFWNIEQCSPYMNRRFIAWPTAARWFLARHFSTLNVEMMSSSETSLHMLTTRRYIPEDGDSHFRVIQI